MMKRWSIWSLALVLALATAGSALAQGIQFGNLIGNVTLSDGSAAAGVQVTVTSPSLQGERSTVTQSNGDYILRGLPPGDYTVSFNLEGLKPHQGRTTVPLGGTARQDARLEAEAVEETIVVTGESASALETPSVGANLTDKTIDALPNARDLDGIARLSPGVTTNTPLGGQVAISGGFAYDNLFLLNGVDINDSVFGNPEDLFIEDAIQETQVLSSSVSAEYGRFTGGVVNAITKSGGNEFEGTVRFDLTNPSYRDETKYEDSRGIKRIDNNNEVYSATLGGYILKDKLWFFTAGRYNDATTPLSLTRTNINFNSTRKDERYEGKLTANISDSHSLQASYINNSTKATTRPLTSTSTLDAIVHPEYPNDLKVGRYSGVLGTAAFLEAQYSEKKFQFKNAGGTSTDIRDSPFTCRTLSGGCHYNGPYFDSTDPEDRDNKQFSGSFSYFLDTGAIGTHNLKVGGERFDNIRTGGNSQSATSFTFATDPLIDSRGNIILDANGHAIPVFTPGFGFLTYAVFWDAQRGSRIQIRTDSLYINDDWKLNEHWSFNLGGRYEQTSDENTDNVQVVDVDVVTPRLAVSFDPLGDGKYRFDATYAQYTGSYNLALWTAAVNTGNPGYLYGPYLGPPGQGRNFAPGFDLNNYLLVLAGSPTQNVVFGDNIHTPVTDEYTFSAGTQLPKGGFLRLTYQNRKTDSLLEDFITIDQGTVDVVVGGVTATTDRKVYRNSNVSFREYEALLLQGRYRITPNWSVEGNWSHQFKNDGNYEGEAGQTISPSGVGDYPEILHASRNFPSGHLDEFEQDVARAWTIYNWNVGRFGDLSFSLLGQYNSPKTYSLTRSSVNLTAIQRAADPGYAQPPSTQTIYFGARGSQEFNDWYTFDTAITYSLPFLKRFEPWIKVDVRNLLNDDTLIAWDRTILPIFRNSANPNAPVDEFGLPTTFNRASSFGNARSANDYVTPREYRFSAGIRF
jgi:carboxypeptidase family protein/TonB-dependent receptor-like protein